MREELDKIKDKIWIIEALTSEAMMQKKKDHHWELFKELGRNDLESNDDLTLDLIIELGLHIQKSQIEDYNKKVTKQMNLEKKLID